MDKKNQIIGILCIICAFVLLFKFDGNRHEMMAAQSEQVISVEPLTENGKVEVVEDAISMAEIRENGEDKKVFLENGLVKVEFSTNYGAIDRVFLKKYKKTQDGDDLVVFNDGGRCPALGLIMGSPKGDKAAYVSGFSVKSFDGQSIVFSKVDKTGLEIVRDYFLPEKDGKGEGDAYTLTHRTHLINPSNSEISLKNISLSLGSIPATEGDITGDYLNFGYYDGKSIEFIKPRDFTASKGFFGLGKRDSRDHISGKRPIIWGSIKNQFFTAILTSSMRASGFCARPVLLSDAALNRQNEGIAAEMTFRVDNISARGEHALGLDFYVGPKDLARLDRMHDRQDLVMQFGFFGIISKFLLFMMLGIHSFVSNWGLAIILLTVMVKLCLWPLTTAQVRVSKKMSAVQAPLKEIREKYKNNPSKIQAETIKLFKLHRINPAAGCLPIFVQIPIFFGLYFMLRTSSELRFAHFLWIKDLSVADTVAHVGSFPINILPIIMCVTTALQMHMTPIPSADGSPKMILKLMPLILLFGCYGLPSGLVLYWTVQNILTIVQQYVVSKRGDMQVEQLMETETEAKKNKRGRGKKNFTK
ncbi:MAG: membrane protein insertase YidC [Puniceicoccales bacterium]|jgi:YidC/Oxa1 family membrane protein insertase|nr:membrane protein insertase YidC [Puniceicoccales bacterium]